MFRLLRIAFQQFNKTCLILGVVILPSIAQILLEFRDSDSVPELPGECINKEVNESPRNITTKIYCESSSQVRIEFEEVGTAPSVDGTYDYNALVICSNQTHNVVTPGGEEYFSTLTRPKSYEIPFRSGSVTCRVTGCYTEYDLNSFKYRMTYKLQDNNCSFPLLTTTSAILSYTTRGTFMVSSPTIPSHTTSATAYMVSTPIIPSHTTRGTASVVSTPATGRTPSMVSTPTIPSHTTGGTAFIISTPTIASHTTKGTAFMVSTPIIPSHTTGGTVFMVSTPTIASHTTKGTAFMVSTPTIASHTTKGTAFMVSTPIIPSHTTGGTVFMVSTPTITSQTTALTKPSPSSKVDIKKEIMFTLLFVCSLPLILIVIFMMSCAIIGLRRREVTKQLADWRTGYGLQLIENQKTSEINTSLKSSSNAPPSPSRSIYTLLHYEADTRMTPTRSYLSTCSSLNSLNSRTDSVVQNDTFSKREQANGPYITSLAYDENQPMPIIDLSEYEHLFSQPSTSTTNLAQSTSKMVASHSVPIFLDQLQNDYIQALAYSSSEAINAESSMPSPTELALAHSSAEVQSDGCLHVSSQQQPMTGQTLGGEMSSPHDENYQVNSEGYVLYN